MAIETFITDCPHCGQEVDFTEDSVPELGEHIQSRIDKAEQKKRCEVEEEFDGYIWPEDLGFPAQFRALAAAIRLGQTDDARVMLDRIAANLPDEVRNAIELGWFQLHLAFESAAQ